MKHWPRGEDKNPDQLGLALFHRQDPDDGDPGAPLWLDGHRRHPPKPTEEEPPGGPPPPAA